jgi:hypothetical protein
VREVIGNSLGASCVASSAARAFTCSRRTGGVARTLAEAGARGRQQARFTLAIIMMMIVLMLIAISTLPTILEPWF